MILYIVEMQLTALLEGKDLPNILESLKNMEQLERIETLYEIMDEVEIDFRLQNYRIDYH